MNYEFATEVGIDIITPAVLLFVVFYSFLPWQKSLLGWAMMTHAVGSLMLFGSVVLTQFSIIPEEYPGSGAVILFIIILWMVGWWMLTWSVIHPRFQNLRARRRERRLAGVR